MVAAGVPVTPYDRGEVRMSEGLLPDCDTLLARCNPGRPAAYRSLL
jgi:hypothetical protein